MLHLQFYSVSVAFSLVSGTPLWDTMKFEL